MTKIREVERDFEKMAQEAREKDEYWVAAAIYDFAEQLHVAMVERKKSKADLAKAIGKSAPYITKILRGGNFTIETMVRLSRALGYSLDVQMNRDLFAGMSVSAPNLLTFPVAAEGTPGEASDYSIAPDPMQAMDHGTQIFKGIGYDPLANSA